MPTNTFQMDQIASASGASLLSTVLTPTGGDDTAQLNAAISSAAQSGSARGAAIGVLGQLVCAGIPNCNSLDNIKIVGAGAGSTGLPGPSSILLTANGGVGPNNALWDWRSATGFAIQDVGIWWPSTTYTGHGLDFSHGTRGNDAGTGKIVGAAIGGYTAAANQAAAAVLLDKAIVVNIEQTRLEYAQRGIRGNLTGYSNSINITNQSYFAHLAVAAITDADERWKVDGNTFEGTDGGLTRCYYQERAGTSFNSLAWTDNWMGDMPAGAKGIVLSNTGSTCQGLKSGGNLFGLDVPMDLSGGIAGAVIEGDRLGGITNSIILPSAAPGSTGVKIAGNNFYGGGSVQNYLNGLNAQLAIFANSGITNPNGFYYSENQLPNTFSINAQLVNLNSNWEAAAATAGASGAPPAQVKGYLVAQDHLGATIKIPYYAN